MPPMLCLPKTGCQGPGVRVVEGWAEAWVRGASEHGTVPQQALGKLGAWAPPVHPTRWVPSMNTWGALEVNHFILR